MASLAAVFLGTMNESRDYEPLLKWILVWVVIAFGGLVVWYFGLFDALLANDRTRISLVVLAIFFLGSLHCLYQTIVVSRELILARKVREVIVSARGRPFIADDERIVTGEGTALEPSVVTTHIANVIASARNLNGSHLDQTVLLRSLAGRLRSREKLGLFVAESLLRLALLGTAIGFILMLIPIAGIGAFDTESLRQTLTGMTSGMSIALNVTVVGIATALLLKFQYFLLDGAISDLFHGVADITEVYVIPALGPTSDAE